MTQVVIPAIRDGAGALVPASVTVRLVGSDEQGRIAFVATDLATEYQDVTLPLAGLTLELQPQSLLALPDAAETWYRVDLRTLHRRESHLIQVPESGTPLTLRDLVGAAEIPPGSLPADIVADVLEAAAEAEDSANTATIQAGIATGAALTATSQAGFATDAAIAAAADALTASGQASIATAQAGEATSQAGTATLQAGLASDSATLAQAWATQTDPEVLPGQGYGALKYAQDAAISAAFYPDVQLALVGMGADIIATQFELLRLRQDTDGAQASAQLAITGMAADLIATQAIVVSHHAFA